MTKETILARIRKAGLVPVIRTESGEFVQPIVEALIEGGIPLAEVTLTTPNAFEEIQTLAKIHGDALLVGAGTVLDRESAMKAIDSGSRFIVTPYLNTDVIEYCNKHAVSVYAGSLTPTEIYTAWSAGADLIKVFPCSAMGGANYLKALKGPFPNIELMPTGGVNINTAADYLKAGAFALGIGSDLAPAKIGSDEDLDRIVETAIQYRSIIDNFRTERLSAAS